MNWLNNGVRKAIDFHSEYQGLRKIFRLYIQLWMAHSNARKISAAKNGPNLPMDAAIPEVNTPAADFSITIKLKSII